MANHLPTEEHKRFLRSADWNVVEYEESQHWFNGDNEIVFFDGRPPTAYGYGALLKCEVLGMVPGEAEVEGDVRKGVIGAVIDGMPVPSIFQGKRVRVTVEVIED